MSALWARGGGAIPSYKILKYPRTQHLEGSRLQPGDEDLSQIPFDDIVGKTIVVEEKLDGANTGVSFDADRTLLLLSRGHYLIGGVREKHYDLFKQWGAAHQTTLYDILGTRYILYGEWLYAKHSIFYDALPHYFMEFDVYDRETQTFLDTSSRWSLLEGAPIVSVPVLKRGVFRKVAEITSLIGKSNYIEEGHIKRLIDCCVESGVSIDVATFETDPTTTMEGVYLKIEEDGKVVGRLKFVRPSFAQTIDASGSHWLNRPIVPNLLAYPLEALFESFLPDEIRTIRGNM